MSLPFEAAVAQLVRQGFARDVAEREVTRQLIPRFLSTGVGPTLRIDPKVPPDEAHFVSGGRVVGKVVNVEGRLSALTITLPWSALESDNRKYGAQIRRVGGSVGLQALIVMRPGYRLAKEKARAIARAAMLGNPVSIPLALVARVWLPDNRPGHDVANFAKCAHDALEKVVYTSDQWLHDVRWIRAGVDVDHPRAEITITPLTPCQQ